MYRAGQGLWFMGDRWRLARGGEGCGGGYFFFLPSVQGFAEVGPFPEKSFVGGVELGGKGLLVMGGYMME